MFIITRRLACTGIVLGALYCAPGILSAQISTLKIGILEPNYGRLQVSASDVDNPSNQDGILFPRVNKFPQAAPRTDAKGLMLYLLNPLVDANGRSYKTGFHFWTGTEWQPVDSVNQSFWNRTANSISPLAGIVRTGVGTNAPSTTFHVKGGQETVFQVPGGRNVKAGLYAQTEGVAPTAAEEYIAAYATTAGNNSAGVRMGFQALLTDGDQVTSKPLAGGSLARKSVDGGAGEVNEITGVTGTIFPGETVSTVDMPTIAGRFQNSKSGVYDFGLSVQAANNVVDGRLYVLDSVAIGHSDPRTQLHIKTSAPGLFLVGGSGGAATRPVRASVFAELNSIPTAIADEIIGAYSAIAGGNTAGARMGFHAQVTSPDGAYPLVGGSIARQAVAGGNIPVNEVTGIAGTIYPPAPNGSTNTSLPTIGGRFNNARSGVNDFGIVVEALNNKIEGNLFVDSSLGIGVDNPKAALHVKVGSTGLPKALNVSGGRLLRTNFYNEIYNTPQTSTDEIVGQYTAVSADNSAGIRIGLQAQFTNTAGNIIFGGASLGRSVVNGAGNEMVAVAGNINTAPFASSASRPTAAAHFKNTLSTDFDYGLLVNAANNQINGRLLVTKLQVGDAGLTTANITNNTVPDASFKPGTIVFFNGNFYGWNGSAWKKLDN